MAAKIKAILDKNETEINLLGLCENVIFKLHIINASPLRIHHEEGIV